MLKVNNISYPLNGIVFLDCDGVINSGAFLRSRKKDPNAKSDHDDHIRSQIDPRAIGYLNTILKDYNLGIVSSSSWRIRHQRVTQLSLCGIDNWEKRYLGKTGSSIGCRGQQIDQWIKDNSYAGPFIILDDDSDMDPHMDKLVKTDFETGLLPIYFPLIEKILKEI